MMTTEHPTPRVSEQESASEHSRLVRAAARLRYLSPQFGWPALVLFFLGPFRKESMTLEKEIGLKSLACLLIIGALALRLATRGYHRRSGFVINGPYRYIRNPVEVGAVLGMVGAGLLLQLPGWYTVGVAILAMAFLSFASLSYERELLGKLEGNYFRYTRRVKRWIPSILPGVNRVNRDYSFLAALREERDSLFWILAWIGVYGLRSHLLSRIQWW